VELIDREIDDDSKHIIAKVGGARSGTGSELDVFFFRIKGVYDESENIGVPRIYWGNKLDELEELVQNGIFSPLDNLFKIVYLDPTIDLDKTFSQNRKKLFDQTKLGDSDIAISNEIKGLGIQLNEKISSMEVIKSFQTIITEEYRTLKKEDISIEMKSELSINGYFGNLIPYIKRDDDENIYPTSGDGRKKILAYSLLNYLIKEQEGNKIIIYLIEEPENSLHRSMQIALSKQLFDSKVYNYFFLSTHSSELLYEMDNASLIRIYSKDKINCESHIYHVEGNYRQVKKELNKSLATALFAERVLLVEGPSEKVLFEKILEKIHPTYELDGSYLLDVSGINFEPYVTVLRGLNIMPIVKTDNDLKAKRGQPKLFDLIGLNRCLKLIDTKRKDPVEINYFITDSDGKEKGDEKLKKQLLFEKKDEIFETYHQEIKKLRENSIFLSRIDLEHDLYVVIGERMKEILGESPIEYLQSAKLLNMIELTEKLTKEDCETIINHVLFESLRQVVSNVS
jgi:putative ATP-dependent endonuclease of OLD family